jgi:prophage maintenance system killer protein
VTPQDWTEIVTLDHLMSTHGREMIRRGGAPDSGKPGCVDGALGTAWLAEQYATGEIANVLSGFIFACFALRGLAQNHCLTDGNKRLAWIAFIETLAALHLTVDVDEAEAAEFVTKVIVDHLTGEDVARWAEARLAVLDIATQPF